MLGHCTLSLAQLQPMFQTGIYFEDAIGNKDTIIVGFDTLATGDYNPNFGEVDITIPFDSIFEVRAAHLDDFGWGNQQYALSKKVIGFAENYINLPSCYSGSTILLFVKAKHLPIKISWNQDLFSGGCLNATFFTPDRMYQMVNPLDWFDMPSIRYECTSTVNSLEIFLGKQYKAPMEIPYIAKRKVLGSMNAVDSIYGVSLDFGNDWIFSPCSLVSVDEEPFVKTDNQTKVFPNPAIDKLTIQNKDKVVATNFSVYDQIGKRILYFNNDQNNSEKNLDIEHFPPGVYYVVQQIKNGETRVNKWVKI